MYEHLSIGRHDDLAIVRVDRPPANAMDPILLAEGHRCLEELEAAEVGAVVVTGTDAFFSAGLDLKVMPTLDANGQRETVTGVNRLFCGWYCFPRPVVCAVNGHAIAGGLILALCGDYRVGSTDNGRFGLTELKVGFPYPAVAMAVVRAELTPAAARALVLRAHLVGPEEAAGLGVLDELVDGDPLPRAMEVARELAALPAEAYPRIKEQLRGEAMTAMRKVVESGQDPLVGDWLGADAAGASANVLGERS